MKWPTLSTNILSEVYYSIIGRRCYLCDGYATSQLCQDCQPYITLNLTHCRICARPTDQHLSLCQDCQYLGPQHPTCIAPLLYQSSVAFMIRAVKFQHKTFYLRVLTPFMVQALEKHYQTHPWPTEIIAVPCHRSRLFQRGFSQTQLLANLIQQQLSTRIPLNRTSFIKVNATSAQHTLKKAQRLSEQSKAFNVVGPIATHIALVDDVITTGSTLKACVECLTKHGVTTIDLWILARAIND